jgi:hypothetical protein
MVMAMHGEVAKSLEYHRLGLITILYVLLQFFFRLGILIFPSMAIRYSRVDSYLNRGFIFLAILFGANWILTLMLRV